MIAKDRAWDRGYHWAMKNGYDYIAENRVWDRGYRWAMKNGYDYEDDGVDSPERDEKIDQSIRDCRIIAMAYEIGWMNGRKSARRRKK